MDCKKVFDYKEMTNYEKELMKIAAHNEKIITEHFHLDMEKFIKQHSKALGEDIRSVTARFSDKEMGLALRIGHLIGDKRTPEDGLPHFMIYGLYGDNFKFTTVDIEDIPDSCEDEMNHLLEVLQIMPFEFMFTTTTTEDGEHPTLSIVPVVKVCDKYRDKDGKMIKYPSPIQVVFNGADMKYAAEQLFKLGLVSKLSKKTISMRYYRNINR